MRYKILAKAMAKHKHFKYTDIFSVLASDGLWDTHSNEEAVSKIRTRVRKDRLMGAEVLAREAFNRGSLDNITVLVVDLKSFMK